MRKLIAAIALSLLPAAPVLATPVLLDFAEFAAALGTVTPVVEDFEGVATGSHPSPFVFANGSFTASFPLVLNNFFGPTNTLTNNAPDAPPGRVFSGFPAGTQLFGVNLTAVAPPDVLQMSVVGGSGTLVVTRTFSALSGFVGFEDLQGLTSVAFLNLGHDRSQGNYDFDNVTTAVLTATVPLPSTGLLLAAALTTLGIARRRGR